MLAPSSIFEYAAPPHYSPRCLAMGEGHVHVMIDGLDMAHLALPQCANNFSVPAQGLASGKHMLAVVLANDAARNEQHAGAPPSASTDGKPSVRVLSRFG